MRRGFNCMLLAGLFTLTHLGADAAVIHRNVLVSGGTFQIREDSEGNTGTTFEFTTSVSPFELTAGDEIRTHVVFAKPLEVTDTGNGAWVVGPYRNREVVVVRYCLADPASSVHIGASSAVDIRGHGSLDIDTVMMEVSTSGPCSEFVWSFVDDLTRTSFVLNGLDIDTTIGSFDFLKGTNNTYASVFVGLAAGDIDYAVEEPSIITLMSLGLAALALTRRRRQYS